MAVLEILAFGSCTAQMAILRPGEVTMLKRVGDLDFDVDEMEQALALSRDARRLPERYQHV
jgi:hypothetical protein